MPLLIRALFTASLLGSALCLAELVELRRFPTDSLDSLEGRKGVELDKSATVDGNGSIAVRASGSGVYELIDAGDVDLEQAQIVFQAKMKTRKVKGAVFLEIACEIPELGQSSIQGRQYSLSGSSHWLDVEVRYPLRKGENPRNVKLNLVFQGSGKAWVDDVRLYREDLPEDPADW